MGNRTKAGIMFDRLLNVCIAVACLIVVFQVISVSFDVVLREIFGISVHWITAINEWGLVYLTFLGVAWLQREKGHIGDDSIVAHFPAWVAPTFRVIGIILGIASCLVLIGYGTYVTWQKYMSHTYDFFKLESVPIYFVYVVIPIGSLLWLIQIIREVVIELKQKQQEQP